jgi:hypothetical protein
MKCPVCHSKDVQRSHSRSSREKLYRHLLFRHYYRCHACEWRGSVSSLTLESILGVSSPTLQSVLGVAAKKKAMILAVLAAILALILFEAYLLFRASEYQPAEPPTSRLVTPAAGHSGPS